MALGLSCASAFASTFTLDFNTDPSASLNYGGTEWDGITTAHTGGTAWVKDGGVPMGATTNGPQKGVTGNGYLQLTVATLPGGSAVDQGFTSYLVGGVLFTNFDGALVVSGFTLDCDMRIGNGNPAPADGFSINYVRINDPALVALQNGVTFPQMNNATVAPTGTMTVPGAFSDNGSSTDTSLAEEGMQTGLSVGFDMWDSADYTIPPASPAVGKVTPGLSHDGVGLDIRVDDTLLTTISMPNGTTRATSDEHGNALTASDPNGNNAATDATSIETGPYDGTGSPDSLSWVHLKVDQAPSGLLNVWWKNVQILTNFQTSFAPSAGRLLMAARVGGNTANIDVDNIQIVTIPSSKAIIGNSTATSPTAFNITVSDSGASTFDPKTGTITTFTLNGKAVTATSSSKDTTSGLSTLTYDTLTVPFPAGSTNVVVLSIKDSQGTAIATTNSFVGISYLPLDATTAASNVDTTKPGFTLRIAQVDFVDNLATEHATDVNTGVAVASAERILHGDLGANTADLTLYTGPNKTYAETKVINYNAASGDLGDYVDDGTIDGTNPSPNLPGMPGTSTREGTGYDDFAMEIITYIQFPKVGSYQLIFNSDDGFRTTTAANPLEQLNSTIVSVADVGRGASDTAAWIFVGTPGIYPFRTVYFQGGGGADLEWSAMNADGVRALINDASNPASLKAYRVNNGAMPAAVSFVDPPRGSGRNPTPAAPVVVEITDGATAVSGIKLTLNGTDVTSGAVITKSGSVSKVVYTPNPLLPANTAITEVVSFTDGSNQYNGTNTFTTTGGVTVPASLALKASDVDKTKAGFLVKTWQVGITNNGATAQNGTYTGTQYGEIWAHQWWGWPNRAVLTSFTGPNGSYVETAVINYNGGNADTGVPPSFLVEANTGSFPDDGSYGGTAPDMPGIVFNDQLGEYGIDNYCLEIKTVLDLQPGIYEMGVNSDDGFRLTVGDGKEVFTSPVVAGEYNGGRGVDNWGFSRFSVKITQAGLYPFRLVFYEGGGGNSVEWFQVLKPWYPDQLQKALVNDTANAGIKAYQYPVSSTGPTYVKSFSPGRTFSGENYSGDDADSVGRAGTDATVSAVIVDGSTPVDKSTVVLKVNGTAVTPTIAQSGGQTTVSYKPAAGFAMGSTNAVDLIYTDRTNSWSFVVGLPTTPTFWIEAADFDYNGGQTKPEASVMPYAGGAYAGLAPVAGTDYDGPNDPDNPFYRSYPNTIKVPVSVTTAFDRGGGEVNVDFRLGWMGGNHWYNYTRTFPAGNYNVYAGLSSGSKGDYIHGTLEDVTGGATTILGVFDSHTITGGWGNNNLLALKDTATTNTVVSLPLSGTKTLRYNDGSGDFDFILFAPAGGAVVGPKITQVGIASGNINITWTGGGTLQSSTDLATWADIAGATTGTYSTAASAAHAFYRVRQ